MSDATLNNPTPQFGTAEYSGKPGNDHCQFCQQPIGGRYYRVNGAMACPSCADKGQAELAKDTHATFVRAVSFGVGAAIVGMIGYAVFEIATGIIIGFASLAVGWLVGTAMMKGSGGVGGRRYQIAAALLTYAAVSMAAVPVAIHYFGQHRQVTRQKQTTTIDGDQTGVDQSRADQTGVDQNKIDQSPGPGAETANPRPKPGFGKAIGTLVLLGLASPLVELWEGGPSISWAIGAFILFIGIKIAWRMTAGRPLVIDGPFDNSPKPAQ
jgi:hypothetical protein